MELVAKNCLTTWDENFQLSSESSSLGLPEPCPECKLQVMLRKRFALDNLVEWVDLEVSPC